MHRYRSAPAQLPQLYHFAVWVSSTQARAPRSQHTQGVWLLRKFGFNRQTLSVQFQMKTTRPLNSGALAFVTARADHFLQQSRKGFAVLQTYTTQHKIQEPDTKQPPRRYKSTVSNKYHAAPQLQCLPAPAFGKLVLAMCLVKLGACQ